MTQNGCAGQAFYNYFLITKSRPVGPFAKRQPSSTGLNGKNTERRRRGTKPSHAPGWNHRITQNSVAATAAEAGMVRIHAHTILPATPQRTADRR